MRIPLTNHQIPNFAVYYATGMLALVILGMFATGQVSMNSLTDAMQRSPAHPLFNTDMAYFDMPRLNVAMGSETSHVRVDIALEIANKDMDVIEGFQPRMTDKLNQYLSTLRPEQLERPNALPWLREQMLKQINSVGSPVPIHDLMFRQFLVM